MYLAITFSSLPIINVMSTVSSFTDHASSVIVSGKDTSPASPEMEVRPLENLHHKAEEVTFQSRFAVKESVCAVPGVTASTISCSGNDGATASSSSEQAAIVHINAANRQNRLSIDIFFITFISNK